MWLALALAITLLISFMLLAVAVDEAFTFSATELTLSRISGMRPTTGR